MCVCCLAGDFQVQQKDKQEDIRDCSIQRDKMDENPTTKMKYSPSPKESCGRTESLTIECDEHSLGPPAITFHGTSERRRVPEHLAKLQAEKIFPES